MSKILKLFYSIFFIILLIVVIIIIYFNYQKQINLGYKLYIVTSSSMEKTFYPNDLLISHYTKEINKNDIIVFNKNNDTITHRVVEIINQNGSKEFITKGDNNSTNDIGSVSIESIEGKIIFYIPNAGKYINFISTPQGILFIIVIPAFILFLYNFQKVMIDLKTKKEGVKK